MNDTKHNNDYDLTLKQAAEACDCAASSLKNNIKSGKLKASQTSEKAPYLVRLPDVERFLRDTPGIASRFHPTATKVATSETTQICSEPSLAVKPKPSAPVRGEPASNIVIQCEATESIPRDKPLGASCTEITGVEADDSSGSSCGPEMKRRRRRRRGRRGHGESSGAPEIKPMALKALAGTTPHERLRLTACLNELASLVASA